MSVCLSAVGLTSCKYLQKRTQNGVVAEIGESLLFQKDLSNMTRGMSAVDSAAFADNYIRMWAMDVLCYEQADAVKDEDIERQVEAYRRSLYVYKYEQQQIAQQGLQVTDEEVEEYYNTHEDLYVLRQSILRGALLTVPNNAPKMDELKKLLMNISEDGPEEVEKYAYQYATGYELFVDTWRTGNQILLGMPFQDNDLEKQLKQKQQLVLQDSLNTYVLQVTDMRLAGEQMPIEFAAEQIRNNIIQQRRQEFLRKERDRMYEEAIKSQKLKIYGK